MEVLENQVREHAARTGGGGGRAAGARSGGDDPGAGRLPAPGPRHHQAARRLADRRRGGGRLWPNRHHVRLRAGGCRPRFPLPGKGTDRRLPAAGRHADDGRGLVRLPGRRQDVLSRPHLHRQSARRRRCPGQHRPDGEERSAEPGPWQGRAVAAAPGAARGTADCRRRAPARPDGGHRAGRGPSRANGPSRPALKMGAKVCRVLRDQGVLLRPLGDVRGRHAAPGHRAFFVGPSMRRDLQYAGQVAMIGLFITGTDTGVGKTRVTAALARHLLRQGRAVRVSKPVATGAVEQAGRLACDDTRILAEAAGQPDDWAAITPWALAEPAAPPVAARCMGIRLSLDEIVAAVQREQRAGSILLVEGVGGLLCPLTEDATIADLAGRIGLPLVIVARRSLGTLNHTLLTVEAARRRGLAIAGVVVNEVTPVASLAEESNVEELRRRLDVPLLAVIPYREDERPALAAVDWWRLAGGE